MTAEHPTIPFALLPATGGAPMPPEYGQSGITPAQVGTIVWAWRRQSLTIALEGQRQIEAGTTIPTFIDPNRYHVFGPDGLALP